jgi:transcriptional regulator with XRE-family HTH domain
MANATRRPLTIDSFIGGRIRNLRIALGLNQHKLGDLIGVSYQQAHKYEHGVNRISAERLYTLSRKLGVPVSYFYEGFENSQHKVTPRQRRQIGLANLLNEIHNEKYREAVNQLTRVLAGRPAIPER